MMTQLLSIEALEVLSKRYIEVPMDGTTIVLGSIRDIQEGKLCLLKLTDLWLRG